MKVNSRGGAPQVLRMRTTHCACVLTTHLTTIIRATLFLVRAAAVQLATLPTLSQSLPLLLLLVYLLFVFLLFCNNNILFFTGVFMLMIKAEVEGTLGGSLNPPGTKTSPPSICKLTQKSELTRSLLKPHLPLLFLH